MKPSDVFIAVWVALFCILSVLLHWLGKLPCLLLALFIVGSALFCAALSDLTAWAWRRIKALLAFAAFALFAGHASAASITFQWDAIPPQGTSAVSYVLKWGSGPSAYSQQLTVTNATATVTNLFGTNYVAVFSRVAGVESDPSNEVLLLVKPPAPLNLRIPVQGAGSVTGPWTNIATINLPVEMDTSQTAFLRIAPTLEITP